VKPENIVLDMNGYARLTDLGIARVWKAENS
jgi:serine/threonine protein kinase